MKSLWITDKDKYSKVKDWEVLREEVRQALIEEQRFDCSEDPRCMNNSTHSRYGFMYGTEEEVTSLLESRQVFIDIAEKHRRNR